MHSITKSKDWKKKAQNLERFVKLYQIARELPNGSDENRVDADKEHEGDKVSSGIKRKPISKQAGTPLNIISLPEDDISKVFGNNEPVKSQDIASLPNKSEFDKAPELYFLLNRDKETVSLPENNSGKNEQDGDIFENPIDECCDQSAAKIMDITEEDDLKSDEVVYIGSKKLKEPPKLFFNTKLKNTNIYNEFRAFQDNVKNHVFRWPEYMSKNLCLRFALYIDTLLDRMLDDSGLNVQTDPTPQKNTAKKARRAKTTKPYARPPNQTKKSKVLNALSKKTLF